MRHYLAVLVPQSEGGWRMHFPDFPGCRAVGFSIEEAIAASKAAASEQAAWLCKQGVSLPHPQTYEEVRFHANGWAVERGIDWSKAVISLVPLAVTDWLE